MPSGNVDSRRLDISVGKDPFGNADRARAAPTARSAAPRPSATKPTRLSRTPTGAITPSWPDLPKFSTAGRSAGGGTAAPGWANGRPSCTTRSPNASPAGSTTSGASSAGCWCSARSATACARSSPRGPGWNASSSATPPKPGAAADGYRRRRRRGSDSFRVRELRPRAWRAYPPRGQRPARDSGADPAGAGRGRALPRRVLRRRDPARAPPRHARGGERDSSAARARGSRPSPTSATAGRCFSARGSRCRSRTATPSPSPGPTRSP